MLSGKRCGNMQISEHGDCTNDIEDGKDEVSFVLVFKLSRFGRNAADVLSSLQLLMGKELD